SKVAELLDSFTSEGQEGPTREGLLDAMNAIATADPDWAVKLATQLLRANHNKNDTWYTLLMSIPVDGLDPRSLGRLCRILPGVPREADLLVSVLRSAEELLQSRYNELSANSVRSLLKLSDSIWEGLPRTSPAQSGQEDWAHKSLEHPAGRVARMWLAALQGRQVAGGGRISGIPMMYRRRFERVLESEDCSSEVARVVIGEKAAWLYDIDNDWGERKLVPVFSWSRDADRADQVWSGYLGPPRFSMRLAIALERHYFESVAHYHNAGKELPSRLVEHLAVRAFLEKDPVASGYLDHVVSNMPESAMKTWTRFLSLRLKGLPENGRQSTWNRWLRDYLQSRASNGGSTVGPQEYTEIANMVEHLVCVFPEFVEVITQIDSKLADHLPFWHLRKSNLSGQSPSDILRLYRHLLVGCESPDSHSFSEIVHHIEEMPATDLPRTELEGVVNELLRLGVRAAVPLVERITLATE
ncbi:MAG: DUF4020 domain-containing protein, partial [bacterium]